MGQCHLCGVEFRAQRGDQIGELAAGCSSTLWARTGTTPPASASCPSWHRPDVSVRPTAPQAGPARASASAARVVMG
jgi:rubredoxin